MNFQRTGSYPFPVFIITSVLCNLADIDFRIEVCCKCLVVISGITIYNIQILNFVEIMFSCISCINTAYSRIESTTKNGCQPCFFETFVICPLPTVFEMSFIFRLVIGSIQIVYSCFQARFHNSQVLIGEGDVNHHFRFEIIEQSYQLVHIVGIDFCCFYIGVTYCLDDFIAFLFRTAGNHYICKNVGILCHFVCNDSTNTTCTDNKNSTHFL